MNACTARILLFLLFTILPASIQAQDLTLDQILAKNLEALGGAEAVKAIESLTLTGNMSLQGGTIQAPILMQSKRPNLMRMEMQLQGRSIITAYDGTQGWMVNPMQSPDPQKMDESMLKRIAGNTDFATTIGALAGIQSAGHSLELLGKEDVEGTACYKIKVTLKSGDIRNYFLDAASFLPVKMLAKLSQGGQEAEIEATASNYKKVAGVLMPHSTEQKIGGRTISQLLIEKLEPNTIKDDSIFKMPAPVQKPDEKKPEEKKPGVL